MASLKDVAAAAQTSIRTVARVLHGEKYVRPDLRERVLRVADVLGYRPNLIARSLRTRRSYEIAVVAWSPQALPGALLAALEETARLHGYALTVTFGHPESGDGQVLLQEVAARQPAAIAVLPGWEAAMPHLAAGLPQLDVPYLAIDAQLPGPDAIRIERSDGVAEAVAFLAARGRRPVAYLGADGTDRVAGYRQALRALGDEPQLVFAGDRDGYRQGYRAATVVKSLSPRPGAVQAADDIVAIGLIAGLKAVGLRVPEDIAVMGFGDLQAAALSSPALSTVALPEREVGRAAAALLLQKIAGAPPPDGGWSQSFPTQLVLRESA